MHQLNSHCSEAEFRENENKPPPEPSSSVKLDDVVHLVDDVSENMTYFKERVCTMREGILR